MPKERAVTTTVDSTTSRPAATTTIVDSVQRAARDGRELVFLDEGLNAQHIPFSELADGMQRRARVLTGRFGVVPGDRVCVFGSTTPELIVTMLAIWRAGAATVVLPIPRRLDLASLARDLTGRVAAAHSRLVLTAPGLAAPVDVELPGVVVAEYDALDSAATTSPPAAPGPQDVGLLQFTSGTTSTARAVAVRHGQMVGNPDHVLDLVGMTPGTPMVMWLPLYHDMGVMTLLGTITAELDVCLMPTESFIRRPSAWLRAIAAYRAGMTVAPNFAYGLAATHLSLDSSPLDLSSLRCAINGAEAIDPGTLRRFVAAAEQRGMPATAVCPMYGLAEATLAVSVTLPSQPARLVRVSREGLADGRAVEHDDPGSCRELASCGTALPGSTVVVADRDGRVLPPDAVGEVRVTGPGVVGRYWTPDGSPHPQPMCDDNGRLMTGDLGFLHDGELYLCGREKDMVIVGGRNLYPEDYEFLAEQVPGVRTGNVMAFALAGTERMVVVAETRLPAPEAAAVGRQVLDKLRRELSYAPHEAVLVPAGSLPKTSSGKRRRQRCRSDYEQGKLDVLAVVR
jgi:fatty-acyl-CoA synthase